jgi:transcriptional regulator of acetoin/glycerol metabolism
MYIPDKPLDTGRIAIEKARFLNGQKPSPDIVRDFILDSWERSRIYGITLVPSPEPERVAEGEIRRRMQSLAPFIELFENVRESLDILLKHKNIPVTLIWVDVAGTVIKTDGESPLYRTGIRVSERDIGTNIAGTCITLNQSMVMTQKEFFQSHFHDSIYAALPLRDAEKHVAGCCILEMHTSTYDPEIVRMFLLIGDLLNRQRIQHTHLHQVQERESTLLGILDHIPSGIIVLNTSEQITFINQQARKLFDLNQKSVEKRYLQSIIRKGLVPGDLIRLEKEFLYREHVLSYGNQSKTFFVSSALIRNHEKTITGLLLAFSPVESITCLRPAWESSVPSRIPLQDILKNTAYQKKIQNTLQDLGRSPWDILITGEKGLFKTEFARLIHAGSSRASGPLTIFDVAGHHSLEIRDLLWGEFKSNPENNTAQCLISRSNSGTLVMNHADRMKEDLQLDFYHLLRNRELPDHTKFNVRFICVTGDEKPGGFIPELAAFFDKGQLLPDPVRSHASDIEIFTDNILHTLSSRFHLPAPEVSPAVRKIFSLYGWPENLEEMQDVLATVLLKHRPKILDENHLPGRLRKLKASTFYKDLNAQKKIREMTDALKSSGGNCKEAAKQMGVARSTFYKWLAKYKIPH